MLRFGHFPQYVEPLSGSPTFDQQLEACISAQDYPGAARVSIELLRRLWGAPHGGPETVRGLVNSAIAGSPCFHEQLAVLAEHARQAGASDERVFHFVRGVRMATAYHAVHKHITCMRQALSVGNISAALDPLYSATNSAILGGFVCLLPLERTFAQARGCLEGRIQALRTQQMLSNDVSPIPQGYDPMFEPWEDAPAVPMTAPQIEAAPQPPVDPAAELQDLPEYIDPILLRLDLTKA